MRRNVVSLVFYVATVLMCYVATVRSPSGIEALRTLKYLIIFGGAGLFVAFVFAWVAMMRGEEPLALTLVAFALPPLTALVIFLRPHFS